MKQNLQCVKVIDPSLDLVFASTDPEPFLRSVGSRPRFVESSILSPDFILTSTLHPTKNYMELRRLHKI